MNSSRDYYQWTVRQEAGDRRQESEERKEGRKADRKTKEGIQFMEIHLMHICTDTIILRITIKETSPLQKSIWRRFNPRNHTPRTKRRLLHIPMIIIWIFIQYKSP